MYILRLKTRFFPPYSIKTIILIILFSLFCTATALASIYYQLRSSKAHIITENKTTFKRLISKKFPRSSLVLELYTSTPVTLFRGFLQERRVKKNSSFEARQQLRYFLKKFNNQSFNNAGEVLYWYYKNKRKLIHPTFSHWFKNKSKNNDFFCDQASRVLRNLLSFKGYFTRTGRVEGEDGPGGWSHVFLEVWDRNKRKWLYIDPHYGVWSKKYSFRELKERYKNKSYELNKKMSLFLESKIFTKQRYSKFKSLDPLESMLKDKDFRLKASSLNKFIYSELFFYNHTIWSVSFLRSLVKYVSNESY